MCELIASPRTHASITEKKLGELLNVGPNDVRKYLGMLHQHRLLKRYARKQPLS